MRLTYAKIEGYKRLANVKINLDSKVIAIIGPNEAGKTTLLDALAYINSDHAISNIDRSRSCEITDSTEIIKINFALEESDNIKLSGIQVNQLPKNMIISRAAGGGGVFVRLFPEPRKMTEEIQHTLESVNKILSKGEVLIQSLVAEDNIYGDIHGDSPRHYSAELTALVETVRNDLNDQSSRHTNNDYVITAKTLRSVLKETKRSSQLRDALSAIEEWYSLPDPEELIRGILWESTPKFLLFDEEARNLASTYTLDQSLITNSPSSLRNILSIAKMELSKFLLDVENNDTARIETSLISANENLRAFFEKTWQQSNMCVRLSVDRSLLKINILQDGKRVSVFGERSAGLRMFVCLVAFLAAQNIEIPPILLVDEAENHLHIDAQADLVNTFMSQTIASRVIYTTHSPACLPPDLGVGVRSVFPINDSEKSEVRNSFWTEGPGYSPLMIAMGAGAAAFTPARYAVLAEGATEMLLLPSLLRDATGLDHLPYQVAPGLSEVPKDMLGELELEGARVVYVVDNDSGGRSLKSSLIESGVPADRILNIPTPGIENLINEDLYRTTVLELLGEGCDAKTLQDLPSLPKSDESSWSTKYDEWADKNDVKLPSKIAVASSLINKDSALLASTYKKEVTVLHKQIVKALGIPV